MGIDHALSAVSSTLRNLVLEVLKQSGTGVIAWSPDNTVVFLDPVAVGILELGGRYSNAADAVGRPLSEVLQGTGIEPILQPVLKEGSSLSNVETMLTASAGQIRWVVLDSFTVTDEVGGPAVAGITLRDVSHKRELEEALRASAATYGAIFDAANDALLVHDPETGAIIEVNRAACELWGWTAEEARTLTVGDISSGESPFTQLDAVQHIHIAGEHGQQVFEWLAKHRSGRLFWVEVSLKKTLINGQERILAIVRDIDERKRVLKALEESEARHRLIVENISDGITLQDANGILSYVNEKICEISGYRREDLIGRTLFDFLDKSQRQKIDEQLMLRKEGDKTPYELTVKIRDERQLYLLIKPSPRHDSEGRYLGSCAVIVDITERKRAEQAQREEHQQLLSIFDSVDELIYVSDSDTCRILYANQALKKRYGEIIGQVCHQVMKGLGQPCPDCPLERILETRLAESTTSEWQDHVNGRWYRSINKVIRWTDGRQALLCLATDLTDRIQAELALKEKEENLRTTLNSISDGVVVTDAQGRVTRMNPVAEDLIGRAIGEALGMDLSQVLHLIDSRTRETMENPAFQVLRDGDTRRMEEHTLLVAGDGKVRRISAIVDPIRGEGGEVRGCVVVFRDITEKHWIEEQLVMSRRMESLGRLAGGISHDFHNIMATIGGYCDLILLDLKKDDPLYKDVQEIQRASSLGLELTEQLHTFSQTKVLQPRVVDLNEIVRKLDRVLRRLIGGDVEFVLRLTTFLEKVEVDPAKIEQVIVNLALNAREAMPQGGRLIIETANVVLDDRSPKVHIPVPPGNYVKLAVTDTGSGISEHTQSLIFEPFFSTKDSEAGSGMGLATVYAIVRQYNGTLRISSEPDRGTTIELYLPSADVGGQRAEADDETEPYRGDECVLVVEDEDVLRGLLVKTLSRLGYHVLEAAHSGEALVMVEHRQESIDLLLTDVVLPQLSGIDLAAKVRQVRPDICLLYMSGYPDQSIEPYGTIEAEAAFIQKPFSIRQIAVKVREVLDR